MITCPGCGGIIVPPASGGTLTGYGCKACGAARPICENCQIWAANEPTKDHAQAIATAKSAFATKHAGCTA